MYAKYFSLHPIGPNLVTWPHLVAREAGKCSLCLLVGTPANFSGFITEQNKNRYWGQPALPYAVPCLWLPKYQSTYCFPQINIPSPSQGDNLKSCAVIPAASSGPNTALMLKLSSPRPVTHLIHNGRIGADNYNDFLKFSSEDMNQKYSMNLSSEITGRAIILPNFNNPSVKIRCSARNF